VKDCTSQCLQIKTNKLKGLLKKNSITQLVHLTPLQTDIIEAPVPEPVQQLIQDNDTLFQQPTDLPAPRSFDHSIPIIPGVKPVNVRPYRHSPAQKDEIEKQVNEMLSNGILQPSNSPFSSPVLLVIKKNGSWRFCIDYRNVNSITIKNKYPLPIVDELLDELQGAAWFTNLDMRSGYHQIRVQPHNIPKTAFKTHHGHWEFRVMPFGLTNAPATFQEAMNSILRPLLRKHVMIFVDDILIYSKSFEEHVDHITQVFNILKQHNFLLKKTKCSFAQQQLEYLGHIINSERVETDPKKIQVVAAWPVPTDLKQLRGFLGLSGYYRRFIKNYGALSRPLTDLLKKGVPFVWTPQHQA
jgi:hypothetical protein